MLQKGRERERRYASSVTGLPLLNLFWTMFELFLWVLWFFLLFRIIVDIFRSDDLGGWGKTLWLIFVIVLPFLGVFVYLIARGSSMGERDARQAQEGTRRRAATSNLRPARPPAPRTNSRSCPACAIRA
jgi:hypothetical protein